MKRITLVLIVVGTAAMINGLSWLRRLDVSPKVIPLLYVGVGTIAAVAYLFVKKKE